MSGNHWTAEEYREYLRTGREPADPKIVKNSPAPDRETMRREHMNNIGIMVGIMAEEERRIASPTCCQPAPPSGVTVPDELQEDGKILSPDDLIRAAEKRRNKYGNRITYIDGKRFDSIHEAQIYQELKLRVAAGELRCILRQVRFDLAETEKLQYVSDFVIIYPDMLIEVLDAKSEATRKNKVYVIKKKLMREKWGIEIREV